jgi:hypothetical protein
LEVQRYIIEYLNIYLELKEPIKKKTHIEAWISSSGQALCALVCQSLTMVSSEPPVSRTETYADPTHQKTPQQDPDNKENIYWSMEPSCNRVLQEIKSVLNGSP